MVKSQVLTTLNDLPLINFTFDKYLQKDIYSTFMKRLDFDINIFTKRD